MSNSILSEFKLNRNKSIINMVKYSDSRIGKMLSVGAPIELTTIFGKIGTIRNVMDLIVTPNYPTRLLGKKKLSRDEISSIPKTIVSVPNYWAIITYIVIERIKSNDMLMGHMRTTEYSYTCDNVKRGVMLGKEIETSLPNKRLVRYVAIVNIVAGMIYANNFNNTTIKQFVQDAKDEDVPLFTGVPFDVKGAEGL